MEAMVHVGVLRQCPSPRGDEAAACRLRERPTGTREMWFADLRTNENMGLGSCVGTASSFPSESNNYV
jgi:hypothetical protein